MFSLNNTPLFHHPTFVSEVFVSIKCWALTTLHYSITQHSSLRYLGSLRFLCGRPLFLAASWGASAATWGVGAGGLGHWRCGFRCWSICGFRWRSGGVAVDPAGLIGCRVDDSCCILHIIQVSPAGHEISPISVNEFPLPWFYISGNDWTIFRYSEFNLRVTILI